MAEHRFHKLTRRRSDHRSDRECPMTSPLQLRGQGVDGGEGSLGTVAVDIIPQPLDPCQQLRARSQSGGCSRERRSVARSTDSARHECALTKGNYPLQTAGPRLFRDGLRPHSLATKTAKTMPLITSQPPSAARPTTTPPIANPSPLTSLRWRGIVDKFLTTGLIT
jgi:hypothetical protein